MNSKVNIVELPEIVGEGPKDNIYKASPKTNRRNGRSNKPASKNGQFVKRKKGSPSKKRASARNNESQLTKPAVNPIVTERDK
jgi:hypothetical protein